MMVLRLVLVLIVTCLLGVFASPALAGSAEADAAFARGRKAFGRGDSREAAAAFDEADQLSPHGVAKYSAALAWERAGDPGRAADRFAAALASGELDTRQSIDAERRLTALRTKLGQLAISGPSASRVSVAQLVEATPPVVVHLSPGRHELKVRAADGITRVESVRITAGTTEALDITREQPQAEPIPAASPRVAPVEEKAPKSGSMQRTFGWVAIGGGVAAGGVATYLGLKALAARDEYYDSNFTRAEPRDRAASLRTATNVTWVVAGVLAATGVTLLLTLPNGEQKQRVGLRLGARDATLVGSF